MVVGQQTTPKNDIDDVRNKSKNHQYNNVEAMATMIITEPKGLKRRKNNNNAVETFQQRHHGPERKIWYRSRSNSDRGFVSMILSSNYYLLYTMIIMLLSIIFYDDIRPKIMQQQQQGMTRVSFFVDATGISCTTTSQCKEVLGLDSSICMDTGYCSNPFHNKGCLANMLQPTNKNTTMDDNNNNNNTNKKEYIRVCSSVDHLLGSESLGYCKSATTDWNYTEIRFMGNNWESVFFETWIVQIILSEILGVPTSVDTGVSDKVVDFYDINSRMEYGKSFDWDAMRTANDVKDCTNNLVQPSNKSEYKSCAHVSLEVWEGQNANLLTLQEENVIERPSSMGVIAYGGWYVPKFTGQRDPSLLNYLGLMGDSNRIKLAATFLRPTKWIDYCTDISPNNCSIPDSIAQRPPADETENTRMFVDGSYTGYFRNTTQNDCINNPTTCTGHIVDYPCFWSSFLYQQIHYLNISLQSDGDEPYAHGYTYSQMVEIWAAANATKSNVIMPWWTPDSLFQQYLGTDAEFIRVTLPNPTQQCIDHRVNSIDRCTDNMEKRIGSPFGACDEQPQALTKVVTKSFQDICYGGEKRLPEAMYNPACETVQNFQMTNLEVGVIIDKWLDRKLDKWKYDPRQAVCEWVIEHFDTILENYIPQQYPRVVVDGENTLEDPLLYISFIVAIIVLLYVIGVSTAVYKARHRRAIVITQVEFLFLLLFGLILIQVGSVTLAIPPSNGSCILSTWLINLGYTMELVPFIVKIAAINKLMAAARNMRRVKLQRSHLFALVAFFVSIMAIYLLIWTILDPRQKENDYVITNEKNEFDETIVGVYSYCRSEQIHWSAIALASRSVLLLWATILAFQTRKSPVNVNESKTLAIMIYSQFLFLGFTLIVFTMGEKSNTMQVSNIARYQSLIESGDVCAVCSIYFIPKLLMSDESFNNRRRSSVISNFSASIQRRHQHPAHGDPELHGTSMPSQSTTSQVDLRDANEDVHHPLTTIPESQYRDVVNNSSTFNALVTGNVAISCLDTECNQVMDENIIDKAKVLECTRSNGKNQEKHSTYVDCEEDEDDDYAAADEE